LPDLTNVAQDLTNQLMRGVTVRVPPASVPGQHGGKRVANKISSFNIMPRPNKLLRSSCNTPFDLRKLCTPATIYFVVSLVAFIILGLANLGNDNMLCVGDYSCNVGDNTLVFVLNAVYILFWTFVLDLMCKNGYDSLSWFVLLIPFILTFIFFAMVMVKLA
jgi:hypothetical protein